MQTFPPPSSDVKSFARFMRLLYFILLVSVGLYIVPIIEIEPQRTGGVAPTMRMAIQGFAIAVSFVVLFFRFFKIAGLQTPDMPMPVPVRLGKLRAYYVVCFVLAESVALYGLALRFIGSEIRDVVPFFAGSVLLYVLCFPRVPPDLEVDMPQS